MLSNRVMRLITTVLVLLGASIAITVIIGPIFDGESSGPIATSLLGILVMSYAIGLVHQICWDLLNFSFLENVVGRTIKRILFIAALVFGIFMGAMLFFDNTLGNANEMQKFAKASEFMQGTAIAIALAPLATGITCLLADRLCWERELVPFLPLYSAGASIVIGIVLAFIGEGAWTTGPIVLLIGGAIFFVAFCVVKHTFIYGEEEYEYVSSGYSGGRSSGSSGYSGYSGYNDTPQDNRRSDGIFLNQFEISMHRIASSHSTGVSLSHGAYLSCSVYSSTYYGGVDFKITGTVTVYTDYLTHQADVSDIRSDAQSEISDIMSSLKSDAESEIRSLREQYTDYDGRMSINVSSDVRVEQR